MEERFGVGGGGVSFRPGQAVHNAYRGLDLVLHNTIQVLIRSCPPFNTHHEEFFSFKSSAIPPMLPNTPVAS
jgi:hypothetical protein